MVICDLIEGFCFLHLYIVLSLNFLSMGMISTTFMRCNCLDQIYIYAHSYAEHFRMHIFFFQEFTVSETHSASVIQPVHLRR
jgi:hypothetical protein